jgi:hypothetical protein
MTELYDKKWKIQYEKLIEFKRTKGHCRVPRSYELDKTLGQWVNDQRKTHTKNKLRLDRKDLLDEIRFIWRVEGAPTFKPDDKFWHQQYEKLLEYRQKNGHCRVPTKYKDDKSLGHWVGNQRANNNNNKLRLDRKTILEEIGFAWKDDTMNQHDKLWHQHYEQLVEYKRINSNLEVPKSNDKDKSLREWINTQRKHHNKNEMQPDRKDLLEKIGFAWKYVTLAARASTNDVRGPVIGSFWPDHVSHSSHSFSAYLCRIRSRKRSPGPAVVWVSSQTKHHPKNRNHHNKAAREIIVQLPTERDQVPALPKPDK